MNRIASASLLCTLAAFAGVAQAHVADLSAARHAAEHTWLAVLLLPAAVIAVRLLRGRR